MEPQWYKLKTRGFLHIRYPCSFFVLFPQDFQTQNTDKSSHTGSSHSKSFQSSVTPFATPIVRTWQCEPLIVCFIFY